MIDRLALAQKIVDEQEADEGLWFVAETASEAYLQDALMRLHMAIEGAEEMKE